ncbi:MAG: ISAzo13-like element transposase-related protein, partial [Bryobacteraceae bacterium]
VNTKTEKGLRVQSALDTGQYPKGIKVSDEELAAVRLRHSKFHGDWNYFVVPKGASLR